MGIKLLNARKEIIEVELAISRSHKSFNSVGPHRNVEAINRLFECENALAYVLNNIGKIYNAEENI